jgi:hypothetical protein
MVITCYQNREIRTCAGCYEISTDTQKKRGASTRETRIVILRAKWATIQVLENMMKLMNSKLIQNVTLTESLHKPAKNNFFFCPGGGYRYRWIVQLCAAILLNTGIRKKRLGRCSRYSGLIFDYLIFRCNLILCV